MQTPARQTTSTTPPPPPHTSTHLYAPHISPSRLHVPAQVFGPILAVAIAPEDVDKVIEVMASTSYGLTSSVWTQEAAVQDAFVNSVSVGTCFVNWCNDVHPQVVWSGVGLSGNGNGAMGYEGFRVLTNPKSVVKRAAPMKFP